MKLIYKRIIESFFFLNNDVIEIIINYYFKQQRYSFEFSSKNFLKFLTVLSTYLDNKDIIHAYYPFNSELFNNDSQFFKFTKKDNKFIKETNIIYEKIISNYLVEKKKSQNRFKVFINSKQSFYLMNTMDKTRYDFATEDNFENIFWKILLVHTIFGRLNEFGGFFFFYLINIFLFF
jgi:hypothetical protein